MRLEGGFKKWFVKRVHNPTQLGTTPFKQTSTNCMTRLALHNRQPTANCHRAVPNCHTSLEVGPKGPKQKWQDKTAGVQKLPF